MSCKIYKIFSLQYGFWCTLQMKLLLLQKSYTEVSQLKVKISSLEETISQMAKEKNAKQLDGQQQLSKLSNLLTEITTVAQKLQSTL